jgi:hypothetical protein
MFSISVLGTRDQAEEFINEMIQKSGVKAVRTDHLSTLGFASAVVQFNGETYLFQYFSSSAAYQTTREKGVNNADLCVLCNSDSSTIKLLTACDPLKQTPAVSFEPNSGINFWDIIKRNSDKYRHNNQVQPEKKPAKHAVLFKPAAVTQPPAPVIKHKQPAINSSGEAVFSSITSNQL